MHMHHWRNGPSPSVFIEALFEPMVTPQLSIVPKASCVFRPDGSRFGEAPVSVNELEIKIFIERPEIKIVRL
jgi:hypothetical protein